MAEKSQPKAEQSDTPKFEFNDKLKLNSEFSSGNYVLKELPNAEDPAIYHFHPPGDSFRIRIHNLTHGNYPRSYSMTVAFHDMSHGEILVYSAKHEALEGWAVLLTKPYIILFYV